MSNIAGKAYAMNVITPIKPALTWVQRLIFMVSRSLPNTLSGLLGLKLIHFARWALIRRDQWPDLGQGKQNLQNDYMLFCSNFNGTWDQYIDAFSDGIPRGLDFYWYTSIKYPHSIPISTFKEYIEFNQFDTIYYYNATPGSAQRDIKSALTIAAALAEMERFHNAGDVAAFAAAFRTGFLKAQNCLASPGLAPVASIATEVADANRQRFIAEQAAGRPPVLPVRIRPPGGTPKRPPPLPKAAPGA